MKLGQIWVVFKNKMGQIFMNSNPFTMSIYLHNHTL